ncbi:MAG: 50S ribosomal protein L34e [Candidatus Micrarchaeota archaeon]
MVRKALRNKRMRKVFYRTPGGNAAISRKRKKTISASCSICGKELQGVNTEKKKSKSMKKMGRKYSGELCHGCAGEVIKKQTRIKEGTTALDRISIKLKRYLK